MGKSGGQVRFGGTGSGFISPGGTSCSGGLFLLCQGGQNVSDKSASARVRPFPTANLYTVPVSCARRRKVRSTPFPPAAKTALAPLLLLSPQSLRLCGDPRLGRCVLRTRWGAALPKPLAHPQERNTRFASVPFLRVRYRQRQIGTHAKNANLTLLGFCRGSV